MSMHEWMHACVLHAVGDLRYEPVRVPERKPGQALVQILASGICGSDVPRVFEKGTYRFPTIPGHEFAGIVAEADNAALVGKRAAVFPLLPCHACPACMAGEYALCANYNYFGSRCDGGFAGYIAVPEWNLAPVPAGVSDEEAAMCEPAAVARRVALAGGVHADDTVAVFGAGPIGLMLAQWARAFGAARVFLADIDAEKLSFAGRQGYAMPIDCRGAEAVETILRETGGRGADVCVEGSGASRALEQCVLTAAAHGRVVLLGNPAGAMSLSQSGYSQVLRRQLTLRGTWNSFYPDDWTGALQAMADGTLDAKPLISHRFPLSRCGEAFDVVRRADGWKCKVMLKGEEP